MMSFLILLVSLIPFNSFAIIVEQLLSNIREQEYFSALRIVSSLEKSWWTLVSLDLI